MTCPDNETLAEFIDGKLAQGKRIEVHNHASACPDCRAFLVSTIDDIREPRMVTELPYTGARHEPGWLSWQRVVLEDSGDALSLEGNGVYTLVYGPTTRGVVEVYVGSRRNDVRFVGVLEAQGRAICGLVRGGPRIYLTYDFAR